MPKQMDAKSWSETKRRFAEIFRSKTRDQWETVFEGTDACVTPVLSPLEAARHPHSQARTSFVDNGGVIQPAPGPRFSDTPGSIQSLPVPPGESPPSALSAWGIDADRLASLRQSGVVA
jgi:alpha-methylacyl-CoA racemase